MGATSGPYASPGPTSGPYSGERGYTCATCGTDYENWSDVAQCIDRHRNEPGGNR